MGKMIEVNNRLAEVRDYYRLSNAAFAREVGAKTAANNNYLSGKADPNIDFIMAVLARFEDISAEWLLRGEGTMLKSDSPSNEKLMREATELRMKLLVKEGVVEELKKILVERNKGKIEERNVG